MDWVENKNSGVYNGFKITFFGFSVVPIGLLIFFVYKLFTTGLTFHQLILYISLLVFAFFMWILYSWKDYLGTRYTAVKIRWDKEGIEMINLFGKRVKIPWKYIMTVKYYNQKIFGKWEEAYYVRYNIPENFIFHKNRFWVTKEIGVELKEMWDKKQMERNWGIKDGENLKIEGGDR